MNPGEENNGGLIESGTPEENAPNLLPLLETISTSGAPSALTPVPQQQCPPVPVFIYITLES